MPQANQKGLFSRLPAHCLFRFPGSLDSAADGGYSPEGSSMTIVWFISEIGRACALE